MKITNAVAVVTGANRGIGGSLVRELAARGARRVYAAARRPGGLPAIEAGYEGIIVPLTMDVTDPAQVAAAAAAAPDVTLLVNNAGILTRGGVLDADHEYLMNARQDDAQRAGERHRLLWEARRARTARRQRPGPAVPAKRLTRLLLRRATA